ncbi:MarR family transcriptional regulator [Candidatus Nitrososphaera sp. FF02]|uniref:MarR family transcriptional regulator n=1 Tax=Candidatus Nitrososphaera sp. FF02 TaxID=3398226 RepID=UPI0039EA4C95
MEKEPEAEHLKEEKVVASGKQAQVLVQDELAVEDLGGNDTKVLSLLNEEGSNYSFKGIMRKLNMHQQSLSRALHRLEEMGLVERSPAGYRLSKVGGTAAITAIELPKGRQYIQLLQTYIPVDIKSAKIVRSLIGKWFGNLRWIGLIESGTGFTLQWASHDGTFQINLRMVADYVVIETNAASEKEKVQAMVGSYAIYEQITKILQDRLAPANSYALRRPVENN